MKWLLRSLIFFLFILILVSGCSPAAPAQESAIEKEGDSVVETVVVEQEVEAPMEEEAPAAEEPEVPPAEPGMPVPTATFAPQPTQAPTTLPASPTPYVEARLVEVEWPEQLYLGDSDVVRMALVPSEKGYTLTTEFPDHTTTTQDVPIVRPEGYELLAVGRLDGVGFTISPAKEQVSSLPIHQPVTWHWSLTPIQPGQQRLTTSLLLRWEPLPGTAGITREAVAYSKGLDVQVNSFFGMSRAQTLNTALIGLALGGGLIVLALFSGFALNGQQFFSKSSKSGTGQKAQFREPNLSLQIEIPGGLFLNSDEKTLLQSLFHRYHRLLIQREFLSGYSGARTFLLIPIRADGRADAPTIAKIGRCMDIEQEYANYETFVKRTLPPVTARIQAAPVALKNGKYAALQYTFIGEPGSEPESLRRALLKDPNPALLTQMFETFGPNWWMQRSPWTFRLAQEYDRLLPPHWILEPDQGKSVVLQGQVSPTQARLSNGDLISPRNFAVKESSAPRNYLTLQGNSNSGQPPLRLRWMADSFPRAAIGRVTASRMDLLRSYVFGFDLLGLPDPFEKLPTLLDETIQGTRTIIHGDLNLENILVGPGGMVWLIDFATTREGHPLMDLAHLEAEIIAHVLAPQIPDGSGLIKFWRTLFPNPEIRTQTTPEIVDQLLVTIHEIAFKCLANPSQKREYWLALYFSCLGALKYRNLDPHQKYFLYLTAAYLAQNL